MGHPGVPGSDVRSNRGQLIYIEYLYLINRVTIDRLRA
jgi:hypothetical protein